MTDMERKTFCAALRRYGAQAQITMAFEEMAELQDVLCKFLRGRVDGDTLANIAEEIADVGIMLDQMAIEFEVEDAVAEQRAYKVRRLRERIEKRWLNTLRGMRCDKRCWKASTTTPIHVVGLILHMTVSTHTL